VPCLVVLADVAAGVLNSWLQVAVLLVLALFSARTLRPAGIWAVVLLGAHMTQVVLFALQHGTPLLPAVMGALLPAVLNKLSLLGCMAALLHYIATARPKSE
jgi:hypothetical protein